MRRSAQNRHGLAGLSPEQATEMSTGLEHLCWGQAERDGDAQKRRLQGEGIAQSQGRALDSSMQ